MCLALGDSIVHGLDRSVPAMATKRSDMVSKVGADFREVLRVSRALVRTAEVALLLLAWYAALAAVELRRAQ